MKKKKHFYSKIFNIFEYTYTINFTFYIKLTSNKFQKTAHI